MGRCIWNKIKEKYKTEAYEVNCDETPSLCQNIQALPTVIYNVKNTNDSFTFQHVGERTFEAIDKVISYFIPKSECACKHKH